MATVAELQRQVEIAREGLKSVDENIKKLTGRDPSVFRPGINRRVTLKRDFVDRTGVGPVTKRQDSLGAFSRLGGRVVIAGSRASQDGRPSIRLESDGEEEEDDSEKPALQSSVVATPAPSRLKRDVITKADTKTKSRNRRMFGVLLGTLQKFKEDNTVKTEKERRREEINKKLEEAEVKEKEEAAAQRRELFNDRRGKQEELRRLERKVELAELQDAWDAHDKKLVSFIRTKASPSIFYLPAKHTDRTQKMLDESKRAIKREMAKRRAELEEQEQEADAELEKQKAARVSGSIGGEGEGEGEGEGQKYMEGGESRREVILKDESEREVISREEAMYDSAQNGNDIDMKEIKPEVDEEMDEGEID